jgi:hypothetical protein
VGGIRCVFCYMYVHLLVLISYLIAQCTVMDHLKSILYIFRLLSISFTVLFYLLQRRVLDLKL